MQLLVRGTHGFSWSDYKSFFRSGARILSCVGATARLAIPAGAASAELIGRLAALPSVSQIKTTHAVRPAALPGAPCGANGRLRGWTIVPPASPAKA